MVSGWEMFICEFLRPILKISYDKKRQLISGRLYDGFLVYQDSMLKQIEK